MSFDIHLELQPCEHCGRGEPEPVFDANLTHNVNGIVDACLVSAGAPVAKRGDSYYRERSWGRLEGWTGAEAEPILDAALRECMKRERIAEFHAMEPENKWGSRESVEDTLRELLRACRQYPKAVIRTFG